MSKLIDAENLDVISFQNKSEEFVDGAMTILEMIDNMEPVKAVPIKDIKEAIEQIKSLSDTEYTDVNTITKYCWGNMKDKVMNILYECMGEL